MLVSLQAQEIYTTGNIPKVHLQDKTRYVCNPAGILSAPACDEIDRMLYALEQQTGIETVVAVVPSIGSEDCFDFSHRLLNEWGVGKKGKNNGLVILLVTDQRCIQFYTGYGLEGDLPDAIWGVSGYNGLVTMDENVSGQWSNVETQYQRRADLIPNLVNTVKGYASHEKETLEGVVEARSKATQMTVDANDLTPEKLAEYQKAQGAVTSALGKLLAITENYPDLKANQNFLELQAQLEGTENRINVARTNFNNAAKNFNTAIRRFPKNILAGLFGFEKRAYFEAAEGSEQAPKVEF